MSNFDIKNTLNQTMHGVYLTGHGSFDKLEYHDDIPIPQLNADDVLIKVAAAGVNNTDINTRAAWYSKAVRQGTESDGADVDQNRIGERVLVRTMQAQTRDNSRFLCTTLSSERNGAFAQYMAAASVFALVVNSDWTDIELASIPCAYSTAEGMLTRANVANETVLVTGASGGVGSAAVQLAKRRGATVIGMSSPAKAPAILNLGADRVIDRDSDLAELLGEISIDVDVVAGVKWPSFLEVLKCGGCYVASGAIAGPIVELDVRTLYLKDLSFYSSTYQSDEIFNNLLGYVERNEIRPMVAKSYNLRDIIIVEEGFLSKKYAGKLVLVPQPLF